MDYQLDRTIKLSEESEYKNLYSWSLQELDEQGNKIGSDLIPWGGRLHFTASELHYSHSINIEIEEGNAEIISEDSEKEIITAILRPSICRNGKWLEDASYSMFGANRIIKKFGLIIKKSKSDGEKCHIWGCVSYTSGIDFRDEPTDDIVQIHLTLSGEKFNRIYEQIKFQNADILELCMTRASGFYSEWSPSISTNNVKILAASKKQALLMPEGCTIEPPRLGDVGEFNMTLTKRNMLNPKQDLRAINIEQLFEVTENKEGDISERLGYQLTQPYKQSLILSQLAKNEVALAKLRTPIWLIFIALCILLIVALF